MDEVRSECAPYIESLFERNIGELIQALLDGIDRDRIFEDQRFTRVRHPLLTQHMGKDIAINTEIHNLIMYIVTALSASDSISNKQELLAELPLIESMLLDCAKDPDAFRASLTALKDTIAEVIALFPAGDSVEVGSVIDWQLRQKQRMPNDVQEFILYPPVTHDVLGKSKDEVLQVLEECRREFLKTLEGDEDPALTTIRKYAQAEADIIRAWFERNGIQSDLKRRLFAIAEDGFHDAIKRARKVEASTSETHWGQHIEAVATAFENGDKDTLIKYAKGEIAPGFPYRSSIEQYLEAAYALER